MANGSITKIKNDTVGTYEEWAVPNGQTTTGTRTLTLTTGTWIIVGFQNWNTSVNDICNYTLTATGGSTRTVRASGKNGGGVTVVWPLNITSASATISQSAWQNAVTTATSRGAMYAFKLL